MEAVQEDEVKLWGQDLWNRWVLSREWKREGYKLDEQSGESKEEEVMGQGIGESEMEELVLEWGWRRDKGSWFQRWGNA